MAEFRKNLLNAMAQVFPLLTFVQEFSEHSLQITVSESPVMQVPQNRQTGLLSGASGGCLQGDASFKVEKAHFTARKKGPENRRNEVSTPQRAQRSKKFKISSEIENFERE